jgi:hypothetical protein
MTKIRKPAARHYNPWKPSQRAMAMAALAYRGLWR